MGYQRDARIEEQARRRRAACECCSEVAQHGWSRNRCTCGAPTAPAPSGINDALAAEGL